MKENFANGSDVPMGLGMALAQNIDAMNYFSALSEQDRQGIIDRTHAIESKEEMQAFVNSLVKTNKV